ncbi:hypothetical protein LINPERPRIM_LOCUS23977 [Linum perenne]
MWESPWCAIGQKLSLSRRIVEGAKNQQVGKAGKVMASARLTRQRQREARRRPAGGLRDATSERVAE